MRFKYATLVFFSCLWLIGFHAEVIASVNAESNSVSDQSPNSKADTQTDTTTPTNKSAGIENKFLMLQSFEPNTVGFRSDSNDVNYMDFKISLKYPLFHQGVYDGSHTAAFGLPYFFFAFTGEWGQYIGTRDSSPVISKRFNPLLFGRYWLNSDKDYIDVTWYGHESNGQSINSYNLYRVQELEVAASGDDPLFTRDYISRGWDYLGIEWKKSRKSPSAQWSSYIKFRYFLDRGLMQGKMEDYNPWEDYARACASNSSNDWTEAACKKADSDNQRQNFDGLSWLLKYESAYKNTWLTGNKLAIKYTTGYGAPLKHNTFRIELTSTLLNLPVMVWAQTGYNSDLIDYYQNVDSFGIALELNNFL